MVRSLSFPKTTSMDTRARPRLSESLSTTRRFRPQVFRHARVLRRAWPYGAK